jgi:exo-1,4-beta-D-glucosaminidase
VRGKHVLLGLCLTVSAAFTQVGTNGNNAAVKTAVGPQPFVRSGANPELQMDLRDCAEATDTSGVTWRLSVESSQAAKQAVRSFVLKPLPDVHLNAGASTILEYTVSEPSTIEAEAAESVCGTSKTADSAAPVVYKPCRIELAENWKLASSNEVQSEGAVVSATDYQDTNWHPIHRMPATVLQILQEDDVYPDLYVGKNLWENVPQDLYRQDWWYRTTFEAPAGESYTLEFPGINYRAEIWLNGEKIADNKQVVGMYVAHEFNATPWIKQGTQNVLAVRVTPERKIQNVNGVELADSWFDWINWKYLGYNSKPDDPGLGSMTSFLPDRNAGVWKPVYLRVTGSVSVNHALVNSDLLLAESTARLTVYANLRNLSTQPVSGTLKGMISRQGKPTIRIEQSVTALSVGEEREVRFTPEKFPQLVVKNPDLWWPYTLGEPVLYDLQLEFVRNNTLSDIAHIRFGIRQIMRHRDNDEHSPDIGTGGNFYLQVNGRDFRVRGGNYTPDLLFRYDPEREADILRYVKDLGINFLRWESKIASEHIIELADEQGIPLMFGWMCCNQWEKWDQWDDECHCVASQSLRSQILMLRHHASVFIWANGSDGRPPEPTLQDYHRVLAELHWQNAAVATVSAFGKDAHGETVWDGIRMQGPYCWRPPNYWFSGKYPATCGSTVEQGDNEHIPTLESLKKFIPEDKLWPINDTWYMHAGAWPTNCALGSTRLALEKRYGPSTNVEDFVRKAQLAHYENNRAQFENWSASSWATHKMVAYWMLNSHWPSFYGNLIDYYLSPGGAYYGAKKGLRPLSMVFDYYATGDNSQAEIKVFNQTPDDVRGLRVRVRVYDLDGKVRDDRSANGIAVHYNEATQVMVLPRYPESTPVFFVRCQLFDDSGKLVVDNTYWQSQKDDDLGPLKNDYYTSLQQAQWADMTALNTMAPVAVDIEARQKKIGPENHITIRLHNPSEHIAFFERATISTERDRNEILPIEYDDNYITVYPGEIVEIHGIVWKGAEPRWVKLEGYNTPAMTVPIK